MNGSARPSWWPARSPAAARTRRSAPAGPLSTRAGTWCGPRRDGAPAAS